MNWQVVADFKCVCGEGPLWHTQEKRLYWTDIDTGRMFWYDPATRQAEQCYQGRPVGGMTLQSDGSLLLLRDKGNVVTWRDGREIATIIDEIPDERQTRFNDVMADFEGRVYGGTMPTKERPGRLYRIERDGSYKLLLEGIGCANGMGFTLDDQTMFFTDSAAYTIWQFDYDRTTGDLTNQRPFVTVEKSEGLPDGMVVDSEGYIWSARWDGSGVYRFNPQGEQVAKIELPANKVTSLMFAGDDLRDAYITSARAEDRPGGGEHAGALFHVRLDVPGRPEQQSRVGI